MKAVAFANNDIALLAWVYDDFLKGCLGFAIYRIDPLAGTEEPLAAMARFKSQPPKKNATTEDDPIQKFWWKDLYAKRGGTYRYRVQPLGGTPGKLVPLSGVPAQTTNDVTLSPSLGRFRAYFNRGIVATQAVSRALDNKPSAPKLLKALADPSNQLRQRLQGDLQGALTSLLKKADQDGGNIFGALYELNDPKGLEVALHGANKAKAATRTIILGNERSSIGKGKTRKVIADVDAKNRADLKKAGVTVGDRILPQNTIPHNKFLVYEHGGAPAEIMTGSTNWTLNAMGAQTNNALIIESPKVATTYKNYWAEIRKDTVAAIAHGAWQDAPFRTWNRTHNTSQLKSPIKLEDGSADVRVFFSPSMPGLLSKTPKKPDDIGYVFDLIAGAKQAVLFLAFDPGNNSILDAAGKALRAKPDLFVRGALTSPVRAGNFAAALSGKLPPAKTPQFKVSVAGEPAQADSPKTKKTATKSKPIKTKAKEPPPRIDYRGVPAGNITKDDKFGAWEEELYKAGFAIIHDKIVVIDPFSEDCTVVTGSHNLGYRASHNNDENMVVIRGHRQLAIAYACHVLDIYDHYAFRYWLRKYPKDFGRPLETTDKWQSRYLKNGKPRSPELKFWLSAP
jgi:hypothetical protein